MSSHLLLDLFCCQGGAAKGYHDAGFDVLGVDIKPQPRYPFPFVQADALEFLAFADLSSIAAIHASPPCQDHMRGRNFAERGTGWLLPATREALRRTGKPWVIENVPGAPMRTDFRLCGCMFGLPNLRRERWFETSPQLFEMRSPCLHQEPTLSVTGSSPGKRGEREVFGRWPNRDDWKRAMGGVDWMNVEGLAQAIPPAYTEYIGGLLLAAT